ncbi:DUF1641 domain-containing protein [Halobacillus litoralis]|uniref:DUF1641 domain-containing protein n=1 Tax=Halobacillus litoralis TaxID=45668 RepID=A0A845DMT1_9BACI|nr:MULTISPECIES: DUF1641 domain-containing protein [Halobacillus]MCA1023551.1 DUF1641 domain-containing protein [Halobacillus litoralis]MYL18911.1 DUF1641 domain-containing protein [Halobacillus litoralis]MYL31147.1 DUF1641 domain-containing protein [Halobacillus halophilus]MYL39614.1 DUF1641 domain-containing protein [Halobacillus litoralis]
MARAITDIKRLEKSREEVIEENVQEVKEAVADNKDAILEGIELLSALQKEGTLETLSAFVKAKDETLANVVREIDKEQYTPLLNNLPELVFLLGDLNVSGIRSLSSRLNNGLERMEDEGTTKKMNMLDFAKVLKDPEINRSLTMLMSFLKGMGQK